MALFGKISRIKNFLPPLAIWGSSICGKIAPAMDKMSSKPCVSNFVRQVNHCARYPFPRCKKECSPDPDCEVNMDRFAYKGLNYDVPCCVNRCPDFYPRFDDLHYRITDKSKVKYAQTWIECPQTCLKPKVICCHKKYCYPQLETRTPRCRPQTACPQNSKCLYFDGKCPKVTLPCCPRVKSPPNCFKIIAPSNCAKVKCPSPSYSECHYPPRKAQKSMECDCTLPPMMCDVYTAWKRYSIYGIKY